jgi:hypothetical protein
MANIYNLTTSNIAVVEGQLKAIYTCPSDKNHTRISLYGMSRDVGSKFDLYIKKGTNPGNADLLVNDYKTNELTLVNIVVGTGETVYFRAVKGSFNLRMEGFEEKNAKVKRAGKLTSLIPPANTNTLLYQAPTTDVRYTLCDVNISNLDTVVDDIEIYISRQDTPSSSELVVKTTVTAIDKDTPFYVVESLRLAAGEKIFVKANNSNSINFLVNGVEVM